MPLPEPLWLLPLLILLAYLLGSVAMAIPISKLFRLPDPRSIGSGNPGATNVLRTGSKKAAAITLIGDIVKGVAPVAIARLLELDDFAIALIAVAAFLGHLFPIYYGFKGGKGVATGLGVILGMNWLAGLLVLATWLLVAFISRISSLSALTASTLAALYLWLTTHSPALTVAGGLLGLLIVIRHHRNIRNLLAGTESRIGSRAREAAPADANSAE